MKSYESAIATGAELGARQLIASAWTSQRDDRNYIVDAYSAICDLAEKYDVSVALEFPSFSRLSTLDEVVDIVESANRPNGGILVDTLYMHISRVNPLEIKELPTKWFNFIHISDVLPGIPDTREGMLQLARDSRLYPGEGCIDFAAIVKNLPAVDYSIELPNKCRVLELGYEEHARRCLNAAKLTLESVA